jgi:hypothetical protein
MAKNTEKYWRHREAWRRIKSATEGGFYFEVVTLCESIISDRLLSYVRGANPKSKANVKNTFADLIKEWRSLAKETLPQHEGGNLCDKVDKWRGDRNAIIHSLPKSLPGTQMEPLSEFIERAEKAAGDGVSLAKAVKDWHRRQLAAHRKDGTTTVN